MSWSLRGREQDEAWRLRNEAAVLQHRMAQLSDDIDAMARRGDCGSDAIIVRVVDGDRPIMTFVEVEAVEIDGPEEEGASFTLNAPSWPGRFPAVCLGPRRPPAGVHAIATIQSGFWAFNYGGAES